MIIAGNAQNSTFPRVYRSRHTLVPAATRAPR